MEATGQDYYHGLPLLPRMSQSQKISRRPQNDHEMVAHKILLSKGPMVTPRVINSIMSGRKSVAEIAEVMKVLDQEGMGRYCDDFLLPTKRVMRKMFLKAEPGTISDQLMAYGILPEAYDLLYRTHNNKIK